MVHIWLTRLILTAIALGLAIPFIANLPDFPRELTLLTLGLGIVTLASFLWGRGGYSVFITIYVLIGLTLLGIVGNSPLPEEHLTLFGKKTEPIGGAFIWIGVFFCSGYFWGLTEEKCRKYSISADQKKS